MERNSSEYQDKYDDNMNIFAFIDDEFRHFKKGIEEYILIGFIAVTGVLSIMIGIVIALLIGNFYV